MPAAFKRSRRGAIRVLPISILTLAACAGDPTPRSIDDARTAAAAAAAAGSVVLVVRGMACPKCVTNADLQLLKIAGVTRVRIDMRHGLIEVSLDGSPPPSREAFAKAIDDAGLTLVEIHGLPGAEA